MKKSIFILLVSLTFALTACATETQSAADQSWMTGFWHMTQDEDGGQVGGVIEFRSNGEFLGYSGSCEAYPTLKFHTYDGDIYVASEVADKGFVSVLFHPNQDRSKLTFTSSKTRNNAIYERIQTNKCESKI